MSKKILVDIDLSQNELQNAVIQPLASDPGSPIEGQAYFNTNANKLRVFNGTTWDEMGSSTATGDMEKSTYDPNLVEGDAFDQDNMADGTTNKNFTATEKTKLSGIEAAADVTDATNVDAAGAVMNSDTSTAAMGFVVDEDAMTSNSATKVPTQQSVKAYVDAEVAAVVDSAPGTLDTLNELAAALGDDASFATTVTTSIGTKLAKSSNLSDVSSAATAFGNIKQDATTSATGVVELATQSEAQAKTDSTRALTAASVADFARKVTGTMGNGSLTDLPITHGLGTQWVTAQVYEASSGAMVECDVVITSSTVVTFTFAVAPTTNQYRYVIVG